MHRASIHAYILKRGEDVIAVAFVLTYGRIGLLLLIGPSYLTGLIFRNTQRTRLKRWVDKNTLAYRSRVRGCSRSEHINRPAERFVDA